jgi:hypothetical protein
MFKLGSNLGGLSLYDLLHGKLRDNIPRSIILMILSAVMSLL